jgi:hypothetical protein
MMNSTTASVATVQSNHVQAKQESGILIDFNHRFFVLGLFWAACWIVADLFLDPGLCGLR